MEEQQLDHDELFLKEAQLGVWLHLEKDTNSNRDLKVLNQTILTAKTAIFIVSKYFELAKVKQGSVNICRKST